MIDTDKYVEYLAEHSPSTKKEIYVANTSSGSVQNELWRIAMSFLIEVERLREQFRLAYDWVDYQFPDEGISDFAKYIGGEEE